MPDVFWAFLLGMFAGAFAAALPLVVGGLRDRRETRRTLAALDTQAEFFKRLINGPLFRRDNDVRPR